MTRVNHPIGFCNAALLLTLILAPVACSAGDSTPSAAGGTNAGGASSALGGALSPGGGASPSGGQANNAGGTSAGSSSAGGSQSGNSAGGSFVGGASNGGASNGGAQAAGGKAGGGTRASGGKAAGGTSTTGGAGGSSGNSPGGANTAGSGGAGGNSANSGGAGANTGGSGGSSSCAFPTSFKWSSTGPLAEPKSPAGRNFVSLKDFTHVFFNNQHIVYASIYDTASPAGYSSVGMVFNDWANMGSADQVYMKNLPVGSTVAPTVFYFTPKNTWVLITQWNFSYATSSDPSDPSKWSSRKNLLSNGSTNQIDPTVICDASNCYLFYAGDDGNIYRSSMPIANFPGAFSGYQTIMTDTQANLFEAVQVYSVKGTGEYLMIVEAMGSGGRYFRAFRSTSLGGTFTPIAGAATEATPFAGKKNVTFTGTAWTNDISHGDLIRSDPNETQPVDPCNMQFLYQGRNPSLNPPYNELPYRPALLTKTN